MRNYIVFGNESAERDDLLYSCGVPVVPNVKPILTGRWGAGKSAILVLENKQLTTALESLAGPRHRFDWYVREDSFNVRSLITLHEKYAREPRWLIKSFEEIWQAEIVRTACALLHGLRKRIARHTGSHWNSIAKVGKGSTMRTSVWQNLPEVIRLLFDSSERADAAERIRDSFTPLFRKQEQILDDVQKCLSDAEKSDIKICVAVEPLDSPKSPLEDEPSIAWPLITALLNIYTRAFQPGSDQLLDVRLCIPWHKFDITRLDWPQKLPQYISPVVWDEKTLRKFMALRINYEFSRVGRKLNAGDPWYSLFDRAVHDDYTPTVPEDSFYYMLRHTNYRPRNLQRLSRTAIEQHSRIYEMPIDDVLRGQSGARVSEEAMREAISIVTRINTTELLTEASRRLDDLERIKPRLDGFLVPFKRGALVKRLGEDLQVDAVLETLWKAGLLGVMISTLDAGIEARIRANLGNRSFREYTGKTGRVCRWSLFEHTSDADVPHLLHSYASPGEGNARLILHPVLFRSLLLKLDDEYPIGA